MNSLIEKIINKHLGAMKTTINVEAPKASHEFIGRMMAEYATDIIALRKTEEKKAQRKLFFMAFGHFRKLTWDQFIMKLRARSLNKNIKMTIDISAKDKRKYYIIRKSDIGYEVMSASTVKHLKSVRVMGKDVDIIKLDTVADAVIMGGKLIKRIPIKI